LLPEAPDTFTIRRRNPFMAWSARVSPSRAASGGRFALTSGAVRVSIPTGLAVSGAVAEAR
jgi:hypothetical protein